MEFIFKEMCFIGHYEESKKVLYFLLCNKIKIF